MVDDHTLMREALKNLLEVHGGVEVLAQAASAEEGLEKALQANCQAVLVDISLPGKDGLWLVRQLRQHRPDLPVLILSMHTDHHTVLTAIQAGAHGYVPKSASYHEISAAIQAVVAGQSYVHSHVAAAVVASVRHSSTGDEGPASPTCGPLTLREREILTLASQGLNSQAIGAKLSISVSTVKTHLRGLYRKLSATDRTQAVVFGIQRGWIDGSHLETISAGPMSVDVTLARSLPQQPPSHP